MDINQLTIYNGPENARASPFQPRRGQPHGNVAYAGKLYWVSHWPIEQFGRSHIP